MLTKRHGEGAVKAWRQRNEAVLEQAAQYDAAASRGELKMIYKFDHNVMGGDALDLSKHAIAVPGFGQPVDLDLETPFSDLI